MLETLNGNEIPEPERRVLPLQYVAAGPVVRVNGIIASAWALTTTRRYPRLGAVPIAHTPKSRRPRARVFAFFPVFFDGHSGNIAGLCTSFVLHRVLKNTISSFAPVSHLATSHLDLVMTETAEADLTKHQSLSSETLGGELEATGPVHRVLMLDEIAVEHRPRWSDIMNKINVAASNVYSTPHRASENSSNDEDIPPLLSCICGEAVNPSESLDEGIITCCMEDCGTKWWMPTVLSNAEIAKPATRALETQRDFLPRGCGLGPANIASGSRKMPFQKRHFPQHVTV
ncbi:hypothetical protein B0H10DRAFT_1951763 [Mycena sp. CBHHK59/15]|nr:hypothetical protein B0H10DRAFT_1951763 [Mycena sp. CBHHK59/15]